MSYPTASDAPHIALSVYSTKGASERAHSSKSSTPISPKSAPTHDPESGGDGSAAKIGLRCEGVLLVPPERCAHARTISRAPTRRGSGCASRRQPTNAVKGDNKVKTSSSTISKSGNETKVTFRDADESTSPIARRSYAGTPSERPAPTGYRPTGTLGIINSGSLDA